MFSIICGAVFFVDIAPNNQQIISKQVIASTLHQVKFKRKIENQ